MKLPGRLSIARIEEDNPLKSYFRLRPILIADQDRLEMYQDAETEFPSDGYIRVVPDKNEMSLFKNRMHLMGRYCMLDLRRYPGENEKIRPNKNFARENGDSNAFIIYSDVVFAPVAGLLTAVVPYEAPEGERSFNAKIERPSTPVVALQGENGLSGPWKWENADDDELHFERVDASEWSWTEEDQPAGIALSFAEDEKVYVNLSVLNVAQQAAVYNAPPVYTPVEQPAPVPAPAVSAAPAVQQPEEQSPVTAVESAAAEAPAPLTSHRAINARITMREQALLAQMGVSPRRGRSLYEIVDEKWRKSRIDQLGHPVPLEATGSPMNDPIENAMTAIRAILPMPEARTSLIEEMLRNETLNEALTAVFDAKRTAVHKDDTALTEMEAERQMLAAEVDALKQRKESVRVQLKEELKTQYEVEISHMEKKRDGLKAEIEQLRTQAEDARKASNAAVEGLNDVLKRDIDQRLIEKAIEGRATCLLRAQRGEMHSLPPRPEIITPSAGELVSDVRTYFERAARPLSNDEAVNLLACLTLDRGLLLSGPVGSGKRDTVRLLAGALGIDAPEYGRMASTSNLERAEKFMTDGSLISDDETVSILMLNDVNETRDTRHIASRMFSQQKGAGEGLRIIMSIGDAPDYEPISAATFDRSYLIRLKHQGADQPWRPAMPVATEYGKAVSLATLKKIFAPVNDLPVEMEMRMTAIRERLDKVGSPLTRRSLDALWNYCSAVLPYMKCSPMELLDLALSQRGLPTLLSSMPIEGLMQLPDIFKGMERCLRLLDEPLPLPALY